MNVIAQPDDRHTESACPNCGSEKTTSVVTEEQFLYGIGETTVELTAYVPVITCASCSFVFTDEQAEQAQHAAVCSYLGVMSPAQVKAVRLSYDMGQAEFADLAGIGRASLSRWESAQVIQNKSSDNLLFLLSFQDNMTKLRRRVEAYKNRSHKTGSGTAPSAKFRTLKNRDIEILKIEADCFDPYAEYSNEVTACT